MKPRVGITGIGIVTALGHDLCDIWHSLISGETGITQFDDRHAQFMNSGIHGGAIAQSPDLEHLNINKRGKKLLKQTNRVVKLAAYAGLSALNNAGLKTPVTSPLSEKIHLYIGTGTASGIRYMEELPDERNPLWYLETYPNYGAGLLSIIAGICGQCTNIVAACTGSTQAIGNGLQAIRNGYTDIALCGGFDSKFSETFVSGFSRLGMLNQSKEVESAIRPFDKDRDGFVLGEGACFLVLESYESARKRKADIAAEICGYGNALDAMSLSDTSRTGKSRAMKLALNDADVLPGMIQYINAHGTGTVQNDREETKAIKEVFGKQSYDIPINSTKSMLGHTFSACGAIESAVCIMSLNQGMVHVTRNHATGDEDCDLNYVGRQSISHDMNLCMMNTSGIGGFNASLVIGKA